VSDIVVLTGPPVAGTDAAADILARRIPNGAVIDTALLQGMIAAGRRPPWDDGEEGGARRELTVRNACALAANLAAAGYTPIVCDLLTDRTAALYRTLLAPAAVTIVLLLPSFDAVDQRNASRTPPVAAEGLRALYESQRRLSDFDHLLDTTSLNAAAVAERLFEDVITP
jgi:hypothetical protein